MSITQKLKNVRDSKLMNHLFYIWYEYLMAHMSQQRIYIKLLEHLSKDCSLYQDASINI